jgi:hypothetical protein
MNIESNPEGKNMCDSTVVILGTPDFSALYGCAVEDAKKIRDEKIKNSILAVFNELNEVESQLRQLEKRRKKLAGRLKGYSMGQVVEANQKEEG